MRVTDRLVLCKKRGIVGKPKRSKCYNSQIVIHFDHSFSLSHSTKNETTYLDKLWLSPFPILEDHSNMTVGGSEFKPQFTPGSVQFGRSGLLQTGHHVEGRCGLHARLSFQWGWSLEDKPIAECQCRCHDGRKSQ